MANFGINMAASNSTLSVLEAIGWVALVLLFVHDFGLMHPTLGFADVVGFFFGLIFDLRFSILLVCLLLLAAKRHKRNLSKEPTLKKGA